MIVIYYYRDIRAENILLDHQLNLKYSDFGLSTYIKQSEVQSEVQSALRTLTRQSSKDFGDVK